MLTIRFLPASTYAPFGLCSPSPLDRPFLLPSYRPTPPSSETSPRPPPSTHPRLSSVSSPSGLPSPFIKLSIDLTLTLLKAPSTLPSPSPLRSSRPLVCTTPSDSSVSPPSTSSEPPDSFPRSRRVIPRTSRSPLCESSPFFPVQVEMGDSFLGWGFSGGHSGPTIVPLFSQTEGSKSISGEAYKSGLLRLPFWCSPAGLLINMLYV